MKRRLVKCAELCRDYVGLLAVGLLSAIMILATVAFAAASPDRWKHEGWSRTDFSKRTIDWSEIISGGPPKDGIPSIDNPRFIAIANENAIAANEPVIGLELGGDARAYPIRILIWHEIVNDVVGDVPVAVTYCPLCNAAIVFDRRAGGRTLTFGTTGKLRRSDLVMYDRETESWWQQFTGDAIAGALTGTELQLVPSRLESFQLFKERHPNGRVLIPEEARARAYGRNPYEGYDTAAAPFLYRGDLPAGVNPMARVVVVRSARTATAVALELVRLVGTIDVGDVTLTWKPGQVSALDHGRIASGREVGNVIAQRAAGGGFEDVPYDVTFAFVFHAFHPEGELIKSCDRDPSRNTESMGMSALGAGIRCRGGAAD